MKFITKVVQVIERAKSVKSIRFEKPDGFNYLPGQWTFLNFGDETDPVAKPLSFTSSPTDSYLEVTKKLTGQMFSNAVDELKPGDSVLLDGPYGNFTFQGEFDKVCMLSGGIGITPLLGMIRNATDMLVTANIILLYSNRNDDDIPFEEDLREMERGNPNLKVFITVTNPSPSWSSLSGRMNREMIESTVPDWQKRVYFICGPQPMVESLSAILKNMGLGDTQIRHEYFTGYDGLNTGRDLVQ